MNTGNGVMASLLVACGISAPLYQLLWFYVAMMLVYGGLWAKQRAGNWKRVARVSIACLSDTQGNFLIILSYSYTSLTSVSVLMQSSFVIVAALSYVFLGRRFSKAQWCGLAGCLIGVTILVLGDLQMENWQFNGSVLGDLMTLAGTYCTLCKSYSEPVYTRTIYCSTESRSGSTWPG